MTKRIFLTIFSLFVLFSCASAHPGRTDGRGGHYDRSTGKYHYHHGYPDHQHPNGICPYKSDKKTGESSSELDSGSKYSSDNTTLTAIDSLTEKITQLSPLTAIIYFYGIPFIFLIICYFFFPNLLNFLFIGALLYGISLDIIPDSFLEKHFIGYSITYIVIFFVIFFVWKFIKATDGRH